jgi:hypothetical protein
MATYTAAELSAEKTAWKAALLACTKGQSYTIGGRRLTRYDLSEIREHLQWLEQQERALSGSAGPYFTTSRPSR